MKRFALLALALVMTLGLLACSSHDPAGDPDLPATQSPAEPSADSTSVPPAASTSEPASEPSSVPGTTPPEQTTTPTKPTKPTIPATEGLFVLPEGAVVFCLDLSGLDTEQALAVLEQEADDYILSISAGADYLALGAWDLGLYVDEAAYDAYVAALEAYGSADGSAVLRLGRAAETADYLNQKLSRPLRESSITYDSGAGEFIPVGGSSGRSFSTSEIEALLTETVTAGYTNLSLDSISTVRQPQVPTSDPALQYAAQVANSYLELDLTYTYEPDSGEFYSQALYTDDLASFLTIGDDLSVYLDDYAIESYASVMASTYSASSYQDYFHGTYGSTVGYIVDYYGQSVDQASLAADIRYCLENGISGTRQAPYYASGSTNNMAYGGNYVEIDLDNQHLWVYRDGEMMVSCPIVSGCVAQGDMTPTGVFYVDDRDYDCELVGEDFLVFVDYWIGFWGSYGIHDASWRQGVFGGDIYLYNGSHGCANVPSDAAAQIYANTTLGMKVIVHGGAQSVEPQQQEILCQTSFEVADDASPFQLGASLLYGDGEIYYSSSDSNVVTVSDSGTVTVHGVGEATVTLTAPAFDHYTSAELEVTVRVHSACDEGRHTFGEWTVTREATCRPGEETRTCSRCGHTETREIPATGDHSWGDWTVTREPSCQDGEESRTCAVCGETETRPIPATGEHAWGDWTVTREPSCLDGEESRTCSICGETETRPIPATGEHAWGEWVTTTEPGCETPGLRTSTCLICGEELTEEIPALGHEFSPDEPYCLHGCGTPNPDYAPSGLPAVLYARICRWCFF